jgi:hypothetical protein
MKRNKDSQKETIMIEVTAWAVVIGFFYILIKAIS